MIKIDENIFIPPIDLCNSTSCQQAKKPTAKKTLTNK